MTLIRFHFIAIDQIIKSAFDLFCSCGLTATLHLRKEPSFLGENVMVANFDKSSKATRRKVLLGAASVLSFLGFSAGAALAAKASKGSVSYRDSPKGDQNCANCSLFISPNACKSVAGEISANGWCRIWKA